MSNQEINNQVRALLPVECPHCTKAFMISYSITPPVVTGVMTSESIEKAKITLKEKVQELPISQEIKDNVCAWADSEDTYFGEEDVQDILKNLQKTDDHS